MRLSPSQQQAVRQLTASERERQDLKEVRDSLWKEAGEDAFKSVTFPAVRKLWSWVKPDDTGVAGVGLVAAVLTIPALLIDLVASPFRLLSGLRNAAEAAYYSARVGLSS